MERWRGKVAIVTGASSGMGAQIASKLLDLGLIVVGLARRVDKLQELSKALAVKGPFHFYRTDVCSEASILSAFEWVSQTLGPISVLVNSAGIYRLGRALDSDTDAWRQILDTNFLGLSIATREAVRIMQKHGIHGQIININGLSGLKVIPDLNIQSCSKFAVGAFAETLRLELGESGSKIKISNLNPSLVDVEEVPRQFLEGRAFLTTEDIAEAAAYVLRTPEHVQVQDLTIRPVGCTM